MSRLGPEEMLGLSVHSLPDPLHEQASALRGGRLKLLAILLLCSLPMLIAYLAFYVVRPQGEAAFGSLMSPVRPVPEALATKLDGRAVGLPSLKGQWLLVKVDGGACVQDCQKQLMTLRQFRLMLGKDMDRVDWVWLLNDQAPVDPVLAGHLKQDGATVLRVAPTALQAWFAATPGQPLEPSLYVVDPMGNAMMRFPAAFDSAGAAKARRDMDRLLRASAAWDTPGR